MTVRWRAGNWSFNMGILTLIFAAILLFIVLLNNAVAAPIRTMAMLPTVMPAQSPSNSSTLDHEQLMRHAIREARLSRNYPMGAVIVDSLTGKILAGAANDAHLDPTLHAEIVAIQKVARKQNVYWKDLVLYSTVEPCPMCLSAIIWAGIPRVYFGSSMLFLQQQGFPQIDIRAADIAARATFSTIEIHGGLLQKECNALLIGYK